MVKKEVKYLRIKRLIIVLVILLVLIGVVLGVYYGLGLNKQFENAEVLKEQILSRKYSKIIYILLHYVQSTLIPISNIPTILAGVYIFGEFEAAILTIIGVILGSITVFAFGKIFGKKTVYWILGEETVEKYLTMANGKEKYLIFFMLLLPGFPDDIICITAGITTMSWRFFLISILITRTLPIFMIVYVGQAIPNNIFGYSIWLAIALIFIFLGRYVMKNWNQVNSFIDRMEKTNKKN